MKCVRSLLILLVVASVPSAIHAQIDARMLRYPDVSQTHIAFSYAGDIWIVAKEGGLAARLSSPAGEETFPRFSPDGSRIAFTGNYDGNEDVYAVPAFGGMPKRLTHHPDSDRMLDWFPGGDAVLIASSMHSGRQRFRQLYRVSDEGGLPELLPLAYGEFAAISPDGSKLAFTIKAREFRTWKRYRGGWAPDIWIYDFATGEAKNLTDHPANDAQPMWHGSKLYFLSDRGANERYDIWAYDSLDSEPRQVTSVGDFDVHFPGAGPSDIVFEAGGRLYRMALPSEEVQEVPVRVVTDRATLQAQVKNVKDLIAAGTISPSGKRVLFEARGELFNMPEEHGPILNLTHSSGAAERHPAWSPDGKWIAYFSDRSGEYQLTIRAADGIGGETKLTSMGPGYRYTPSWSPDSQMLVFIDEAMRIHLFDRRTNSLKRIHQEPEFRGHGSLASFRAAWSPDSRWIAWGSDLDRSRRAIAVYDTRTGERHQVTSGYYVDDTPVFDPEGKYLYFQSNRGLRPVYSDLDNSFVYPNTTRLVAAPLRRDVPSPLAPRNDVEGEKDEGEKDDEANEDEKSKGTDEAKKTPPKPVAIDLEAFEERIVLLPPASGRYAGLTAVKGKLVYRRRPLAGQDEKTPSPLVYWDLEEREEKTIVENVDDFELSADGKKVLIRKEKVWHLVKLAPEQKPEKPLRTAELETTVDPRAEWRQMFADAWRLERDYFYDPNMHGVDWEAMRTRYGALIDDAVTRWDVNYILGELIGELGASHTYRGGGDVEQERRRPGGLLGVDWRSANGAWQIETIVEGAPWDAEVRSPLRESGIDVRVGDYVLAVNGVPLDPAKDPWAAFEGLAGKSAELTVSREPAMRGARKVVVELLDLEKDQRLRHLAWIEANRQRVDDATDGQVGYIYVPSTGVEGQTELVRQFRAQHWKAGLIIDERFNSGGQIPDRFIELLNRPPLAYWAVREGSAWSWPPVAHFGAKVMLINGWSGSGGDAFPDYFRRAGLGPLIGTRTWGGLIGISGNPQLVDGGGVTVPTFRMLSPQGEWFREGHGVEPDVHVPEQPAELARGHDAQLETAIRLVMEQLEQRPWVTPELPPYERRIPGMGVE